MTRYNDEPDLGGERTEDIYGYRDGVERVLEYISTIHGNPTLINEVRWAIKEGII